MRYSGTYICLLTGFCKTCKIRNVCLDFAKYFAKSRFWRSLDLSSARRSQFCETFANSRHWKFGICEIFCRIKIFEIVTIQLAIKDHVPVEEYQDDRTDELTVTCALLVHAQGTTSQTQHHTMQLAQFNSFVLSFIGFM